VTAPPDKPPVVAGDANASPRAAARPFPSKRAGLQNQVQPSQRLQEMDTTLQSMHGLLKQMQAKNASSKSIDPIAKANLEMWELLLAHLDKEFHQLQVATAAREDLEARRASLYRQADAKAAKEAQDAAAAAAKGQSPPPPSTVPPSPKEP
jgi:peptidoglycan hydrolase CwlO-like protein